MITQIKKIGNSLTIRLPSEFARYMDLVEGDWIDISDVIKVQRKPTAAPESFKKIGM